MYLTTMIHMRTLRSAYTTALLMGVVGLYAVCGWMYSRQALLKVDTKMIAVLFVGMLLACIRLGRFARHVSTFVHELGHCVGAVMVGALARSIKYQPDSSGVAVLGFGTHIGRIRRVIVLLAGYASPSIMSGAIISGVLIGRPLEILVGLTALALGALTLLVRNMWGMYVTMLICLSTGIGAYYLSENLAKWALLLVSGVLLSRGVIDSVEQYGLKDALNSDADIISKTLYGIPRQLVAGLQVFFNLASLLAMVLLLVFSL